MFKRAARNRFTFRIVGSCSVMLSLGACGGGSAGSSSSGATTTEAPAATTTTVESTTTTALPTTTTTPPVVFTLRGGGLGPFDFGADPATVIAGLTERFGAPVSDITTLYPTPTGGGYFHDDAFTHNFFAQFGRTVCWSIGLCVNLGGVDSLTATFVGWRYEGDTEATLSTDTGIALGSRLSDHPEITDPVRACFAGMASVGGDALYDGLNWIGDPRVIINYRSEGIPFDQDPGDVSGTGTDTIPPADVTFVKRLRAGQNPNALDNYCG